jgi:hypothetical protein
MALCEGGKLRSVGDGAGRLVGYIFWCPGCDGAHAVYTALPGRPCWGFNGNVRAADVYAQPSRDVGPLGAAGDRRRTRIPAAEAAKVHDVCHSFITDGRIQFLGDCTHKLAGQTVEIPPGHPITWRSRTTTRRSEAQ